jgi:tetratricopeptide (TPR) repeat protein
VTPTLQIAQGEGRRIDVCFASSPSDRRVASAHLDFSLGLKEQDSLRWYWEDFIEHPNRNTRRLASDVEKQIQTIGERLFQRVFRDSEAQQIWSEVAPRLAETRVEIVVSGDGLAQAIPWELMRDPLTGVVLSTQAAGFARRLAAEPATQDSGAEGSAESAEGPLRILMVICQPPGPADPPFRSAARLLVNSLADQPRTSLVLDVLRPPTFGQLTSALLEAEALGEPYHVLHFDGHAIVADIERDGIPPELPQGAGRLPLTQTLAGLHGYLVFDYPTREQTVQLVDGPSMGELLAESRVPLLVLNACQPSRTKQATTSEGFHVRRTMAFAFDSLARDILGQGVNAVVQFPYHLGSVASSHWLRQVYLALAQGSPVSAALTAGRRRLQEEARLQISYGPVRREDWPAAIGHEHRASPLVRRPPATPEPAAETERPAPSPAGNALPRGRPGEDLLDPALPPRPAVGFLGRDDTILAIERALAAKPVVLLRGEEGAGKSATAAEFARWYAATGGVEGPVLYTSFEHHKPLSAVLDQLAGVFRSSLESAGYVWRSMSNLERRQAAPQLLNQIPVLWIWDSVDAIHAASPEWTADELRDIAEFLRQASESQAKFLLTSRSTEDEWLGGLAVPIELGPLPLWEALQLTRALVEQKGCWPPEIDSWRPLLDLAAGNPLAVQALVTEALRSDLRSAQQIEELARQAAAAPSASASAAQPAPGARLDASLRYVLRHGFDDEERSLLALLHLFRGTLSVELLESMGAQHEVWKSKNHAGIAIRRQPRPFPAVPPAAVLDRAASYGLVRRVGEGAYSIHPAMDRASAQLFSEFFPSPKKAGVWNQMADRAAAVAAGGRMHLADEAKGELNAARRGPAGAVVGALAGLGEHGSLTPFGPPTPPEMAPNQRAMFAYVQAVSRFGTGRYRYARDGSRQAVSELAAQEPNLRHACRLAGEQQWWDPAAGITEGLGALYEADGRLGEWEEMVDGLQAVCADGKGHQAKAGRERLWRTITEQGVKISRLRERLPRAEQLQRLCVEWDRRQAEAQLDAAAEEGDPAGAAKVRTLAESLFHLSEILREEGTPAVKIEEEAIALRERLGEKQQASMWAFELGAVYTETPSVRDLAQAERWLKRSLELIHDDEPAAQADCLAALGRVGWERFNEARKANAAEGELRRHLTTARQYYQLALEHDLPGDWAKLATHNQQLGHVSYSLGDIDRALPHYRESIRCDELHGNTFGAAQTRFNVAIALRDVDRLGEARKLARAAQQDFQTLGPSAKGMLDRCDKLVANIEERLKVKRRERGVLNGG